MAMMRPAGRACLLLMVCLLSGSACWASPKVPQAAGRLWEARVANKKLVVHVDGHLRADGEGVAGETPMLPLFDDAQPRIIACRGTGWQLHERPDWEFTAENAGLAAAIRLGGWARRQQGFAKGSTIGR